MAEGERRGREREGLRGRESGEGGRGVKKGKKITTCGPHGLVVGIESDIENEWVRRN